MIFSFLNIRPKTKAVIAGLLIGAGCLWGVAFWQEIPAEQLLYWLMASVVFVIAIILASLLLIATIKLASKAVRKIFNLNGKE
ncbi:MAG: hypothetical protein WDZ76_04260 [Pseudohongiellaceae bacterium]